MTLTESVRMAFKSVTVHKMRSVLTMLGIAIGVGAIITTVAIGKGGEVALKAQFAQSSSTLIPISYGPTLEDTSTLFEEDEYVPNFTEEDIRALEMIDEVKVVIPYNSENTQVFFQEQQVPLTLTASTYAYQDAYNLQEVEGWLPSQDQYAQADNIVIINEQAKKELFPGEDTVVGTVIEVEGQPLKVMGVYKKNTQDFFESMIAIIPLSLYAVLYGDDNVYNIALEAADPEAMLTAGEKACDWLNEALPEEAKGDFQTFDTQQLAEGLGQLTNIITFIISGIAGISLVVGGIGVMNIMLVSVTERTREIGIRKALGATRQKILLQFLIESIVLTSLGGILGILLGAGAANLISLIANWPPLVSLPVVVGGVLFSMVLGVVFGLLPANNAARMDPIGALRYE
jgi:putative ABC transport system permease protein